VDYEVVLKELYSPFMKYLTDNGYAWDSDILIEEYMVNVSFAIRIPDKDAPIHLTNTFTTDYFESFSFDMQDAFEAAIENRISQEEI